MVHRSRADDAPATTTIRDVAARAGVGMGTVSRVLNEHPSVTPTTRAKVLEAVTELGFQPSRVARALSRQRTGTIAVVCPLITLPSAVERLRGIIAAAACTEYELILHNLDQTDRTPGRFARVARRDLADGVLLVSFSPTDDEVASLQGSGLPSVVVDGHADGLCSVMVDDVEGGRMAARHLLRLGHQRVGFIGDHVDPSSGFTSSRNRLEGMQAELRQHGLLADPALVRLGDHGFEAGCAMARELLTLPDRPSAVFTHSDTQALAVLHTAAELGLAVPDDLSVIGFDDIDVATFAGLSTVRQPLARSGELGLQLLTAGLASGTLEAERHVLPLEVVQRRTTGPSRSTAPCPPRAARPRPPQGPAAVPTPPPRGGQPTEGERQP